MIVPTELNDYIESLVPQREASLMEIEAYAKKNHVPIMELVGIEALLQFLRLAHPSTILEIGTAIGYSAIRMAKALPHSKIITIERDEPRYLKALELIQKEQLTERIHAILGDALELSEKIREQAPYDVIFIDAAKGQYTRFFELYSPFLSENGVVISDNILFRGLVVKEDAVEKRHKTMVKKIKAYNEWLMSHSQFDTAILTIGDGIAISRKR